MEKKFLAIIFFLMLSVSVAGAMAIFSNFAYEGTDAYVMSNTMSGRGFADQCTIYDYSRGQPLVDEDNNIWLMDNDKVAVYGTDCTLYVEKLITGTVEGDPALYDWNGYHTINMVINQSGDMRLVSYSLTSADVLTETKNQLIKASSTLGCSGVYCLSDLDSCYTMCADRIYQMEMTANITSYIQAEGNYTVRYYPTTPESLTWDGESFGDTAYGEGITATDVDNDGHTDILFYYISQSGGTYYMNLQIFTPVTTSYAVLQNATLLPWSVGGSGQDAMDFFPLSSVYFGQIGAANSLKEIFFSVGFQHYITYVQQMRVYDYQGSILNTVSSSCSSDRCAYISNFAVADINHDNLYDYCALYRYNATNESNAKVYCWNSAYAEIRNFTIPDWYSKQGTHLALLNYDGDNELDVATIAGIYNFEGEKLFDFGLPYDSQVVGAIFTLDDVDDDGYIDLLLDDYNSNTVTVYRSGYTAPSPEECELPDCGYPCIFYDAFNYSCHLEDMGWTLSPSDPTLAPEGGKLCKDTGGSFFAQKLPEAYADEQIVSDEFDMTVYDGVTPIHEFVWYDGTDDVYKTTYYLWWWIDNGTDTLWIHRPSGGSWVAEKLCDSCWSLGTEHHYRIVQYHQNTGGDHFYNTSSGKLEPILPNTYYVIIDGNSSKSFYNLPVRDALNSSHSNLMNDVTWRWYNEEVCIDNAKVYAGTQFSQGEFEEECPYHPVAYEFPILWADYFQYNDRITRHGWGGYPFVVGDNPFGTCDILYYDRADYGDEIYYDMSYDVTDNFEISFDLLPDDDQAIGCYADGYFFITDVPGGVYNRTYITENNLLLSLYWDTDCKIHARTAGNNWSTVVGNYHGGECQGLGYADILESYKIDIDFDTKTYDFYFTNCTSPYSYVLGCDDCPFTSSNVSDARAFRWFPDFSTTSYGWWLDTANVIQTEGYAPANISNFCYFEGCIYHDHFDYTDSTYGHGWYMHETAPNSSVITLTNQTYGYYFDHTFDVFRNTDGDGTVTVQFYAMIPDSTSRFEDTKFLLYGDDYSKRPLYIDFGLQTITAFSANNQVIGHFSYDVWNTYTFVLDLNSQTFDFYIGSNKYAEDVAIEALEQSDGVAKVGFKPETGSVMYVDYVTVAKGSSLIEDVTEFEETGVPSEHLKLCWDEGEFDWSCCSAKENSDKSLWCPFRTTMLFGLASTTVFILKYILYFLILAALFVLVTPYILHAIKSKE